MKTIKLLSAILILTLSSSCNKEGAAKKSLETEIDSVSYAIGLDMANKLKANFTEADSDLFVQGFKNGIDSLDLLIDGDAAQVVVQNYFQKKQAELRENAQAEALKKAEEEFAVVKAEGVKFLEENKSKEDVQVTESGLQYIVLKKGTGEKPLATSKVKVHYHGTLADGTVFDSSVDRGTPSEFVVSQVIKGWTEGLQLMNVGSKYKFFVPQDLAYGAFPRRGGEIRPFDMLIFDVELLEIVK